MNAERITITINLGNEAMRLETHIADALRVLAQRFEDHREPTKVMDTNGNSVGTVEYTPAGWVKV